MTVRVQARPRGSAERWCQLTLRGLAVSFALVGACFLLAPDATIHVMNRAGGMLGDFTPAPPSALRFWLSLATGYMVLVTALAHLAQRDLRRRRDLLALLALGKATSSLTCLVFYLCSLPAFIYLANFWVDGTIALAAAVMWALVPSFGAPAASVADGAAGGRAGGSDGVMQALLEAMVPPGGAFEEGACAAPPDVDGEGGARGLGAEIEAFVAGAGPRAPQALRLGLRLLDVSPFLLPPVRRRRFSRLPLDERVRLLEAWERSRLMPRRQAMHALKLLVMLHVYSRPAIEARLGYPPPLARVPRPQVAP